MPPKFFSDADDERLLVSEAADDRLLVSEADEGLLVSVLGTFSEAVFSDHVPPEASVDI